MQFADVARTFIAFRQFLRRSSKEALIASPTIIARPDHNISRAGISKSALRVLYELKDAGYDAHLVGGSVRDMLLGREPKDFDVATEAHPDEVKQVFGRHCRLIGRRFRLAHVRMGREIIEVATFRALLKEESDAEDDHESDKGMILRDNVYGTLEEDAARRDFTVNALYYNIKDFSIIDYSTGIEDLEAGRLKLLGDPQVRFREDPVRMLRAVRFAAKLGFNIDEELEQLIPEMAPLLNEIPSARLYDECLKIFHGGQALETFEKLRHYHLFETLFPETEECLAEEEEHFPITFVNHGLANTDARIRDGMSVTPAFLFAVLMWEPVRRLAHYYGQVEEVAEIPALQRAGSEILSRHQGRVSIPKRFTMVMREIWQLQPRFAFRNGKRPLRLMGHPRFRAAYDFMVLRAKAGETEQELADWWTKFQETNEDGQKEMTQNNEGGSGRRRRRRRPRNRNRSNKTES